MKIDAKRTKSEHSVGNKVARGLWAAVWLVFFRPTPKVFHAWRRMLLRMFGAKIGKGVAVHSSARIWAPWNLEMGDHSCISHFVDCYSVDKVVIGANATVSQYSFLCTASHDHEHPRMPLITAPISIGSGAWVAADVFVGPGVTVEEGAVVGARSCVLTDVPPWTIVAGHPAKVIKARILKSMEQ